MKLWPHGLAVAALMLILFGLFYAFRPHPGDNRPGVSNAASWQRMVMPGELSAAHAHLGHNCAACHTPGKDASAAKCMACHANNQTLLQRQPTSFHAQVGSCRECHPEHQNASQQPPVMDHAALARIGLRQLELVTRPSSSTSNQPKNLDDWIAMLKNRSGEGVPHGDISPLESALNCFQCHSNMDPHKSLFGNDCAKCHATAQWTIPEFRHPSPASVSCAQCHLAPPSHFMEHFHMVSMRIAKQPHARVNQCHFCHQTTGWNDIKGVGYYKHH